MSKRRYPLKSLAFFIVSTLLLWIACAFILLKPAGCSEKYRNDQTVKINNHILKTQLAKTQTEQVRGLGGKACIPDDQAMLFEFNKVDYYPFWMKDMKFPIDIIWLDSNKKVVTIKANVQPSTYSRTFSNAKPAKYVLELKSDNVVKLGITSGTQATF
jgi:uncharacterized membrane protein (UPF0127 family)